MNNDTVDRDRRTWTSGYTGGTYRFSPADTLTQAQKAYIAYHFYRATEIETQDQDRSRVVFGLHKVDIGVEVFIDIASSSGRTHKNLIGTLVDESEAIVIKNLAEQYLAKLENGEVSL